MNATLQWSLSDPIRVKNSTLATPELLQTVFPGGPAKHNGEHQKGYYEVIGKFSAYPDIKCFGEFKATVWTPDFFVHALYAMEMFKEARVEHEGTLYMLRAPSLHEYLSFLSVTSIQRLIGLTGVSHKDDFPEAKGERGDKYFPSFNVMNVEYGDSFPSELTAIDVDGDFNAMGSWLFVLEEK